MIDRAQLREIDWVLTGLVLLNTIVGIVLISSTAYVVGEGFVWRQLLWLAAAIVVAFVVASVDYKNWLAFALYLFGLCVVILLGLLVFGRVVSGARSWFFRFAFLGGQPSELAKIFVLLVLARLFSEYRLAYVTLGLGALSAALVALPVGLIVLQPDVGTALCFTPLLFGSLFMAGMNRKMLALILIGAVLFGVAGWSFGLKDYQKKRIETLLNPGQDPRGAGYHVLQSKIAIGSGGLLGKGFQKGTQSQLRFLPARHTDFIFAVLGEEFGFAGVLAVLLLYFALLARMFRSVGQSRDRAGMYIIFLAACLLSFQFLVNVLMIAGLLPITGIPIPFLSYGGSSLVTSYMAAALVLNVKMRRFVNA